MYLVQGNTRINNRKWNLGRLALAPVGLGPRGISGLARRKRLGDYQPPQGTWMDTGGTSTSTGGEIYVDPGSGYTFDASTGEAWDATGTNIGVVGTPTSAAAQNPTPVKGSATNAGITTVVATQPSTNPLDYTSPQAAIAAGLPQDVVYNAWTIALSRFSSPQAAISAGVPAGVVNQLWQQAHELASSPTNPGSGISSTALLVIGLGAAAFLFSAR